MVRRERKTRVARRGLWKPVRNVLLSAACTVS